MKAWLKIDTHELDDTLDKLKNEVSPEKYNIILRHTVMDVSRKVVTLATDEIKKEYHHKNRVGKIRAAFRKPQMTGEGRDIGCIIPVIGARGTIANGKGFYPALKRGPGAKVLLEQNTILPHKKGGRRVHFYIPSGQLAGHVFAIKDDGRKWQGARRKHSENMAKGDVKEVGTRPRTGSLVHGVGIAVPQMPMTRSAEGIQEAVLDYAGKRLAHYQEQVLNGTITR